MPDTPRPDHHAAAGGVTVEVVRRTWDQVVDRLRTIRRLTWTLVSENAQVLALDGNALTLGFPTQGLADAFNQRGHSDCVKEALDETLGIERKVVGVVGGRAATGPALDGPHGPPPEDGPDDPGPEDRAEHAGAVAGPGVRTGTPAGPPSGTASGTAGAAPAGTTGDRAPGPTAPPARPVGEDGWPEVSGPSARQAPPAAAVRAAAPATAEPEQPRRPRVEPIAPEPQVEDVISLDDPSADVEGAGHGPDVLARLLGAQVIEDRRTDG